MTTADATELVAHITRWWPQSADRLRTEEAVAGYAETLADIAPEHARAAVDAWSRDGNAWPPTAGQLRVVLADLAMDLPDWWAVKAALTGHSPVPVDAPELPDHCLDGVCDGGGLVIDEASNTASPCSCRPRRQAIKRARRGQHPLVAEFIRAVGPVELADLDDDRTAEAQVRRKWEEFAASARRQLTYAGIEPAGLPALERIAGEGTKGLRRFDPRRLLGGREAA